MKITTGWRSAQGWLTHYIRKRETPLPIRLSNKPHYCAGEPVPHVGEGVGWEQAEEFHQTAALECEAAPLSDEIRHFRMVTAIGIETAEVA